MPVYTDKKTGRLYVQFDHQRQTYKFRLPAGTTKRQAEQLETKKKSELFFESHGVVEARETLYEDFLVAVYLPFIEANRCGETFKQCVRICKDSLKFFKGRQLRSIKPADIDKFKTHRMSLQKFDQKEKTYTAGPRTGCTIAKEVSHISALFTLAIRNGLCEYNPCSVVEMPRYDNVQNDVLSPDAEDTFLAAFDSPWARDVSRVILNTGLRQNDVLGLTKFQVDWTTDELVLTQGKTTQRVRIPMNDTTKAIIRDWWDRHQDSELVFPSPKSGEQGRSIKTALKGASQRAGILPVSSRTLRRTFGTRLHELGYDDMTVAGLLGHRDLRSVHRYKRGTAIKRDAVNSLERGVQVAAQQRKKAAGSLA